MNDFFNIINKPVDWKKHDEEHLADKLKALAASVSVVEQRDLDSAAERFQPSQNLLNVINAMLAARVPLLLTGEPGTGKTQVAWFIRRFFKIPLFAYQVHSNSKAADMRYDFDAVAYLRDAYLAKYTEADENVLYDNEFDWRSQPKYLKQGVLWKAYECESECVLLIDEIDKAPRDFPNDLLQELDQNKFEHPFHGGKYISRRGMPPITIITSNGERRLPDAFLRRCIVFNIVLTKDLLLDIMTAWQSTFPYLDQSVQNIALRRFYEIRSIPQLSKKPGAAELLLWLSVLSAQGVKINQLKDDVPLKLLPALACLIKDYDDYQFLGG
ncbi:MAG: MoxR family ATPase [Candidatus Thiothrix putei]|uniref:MoxR family ATPase n=1 Tax=Candidatus Thiothrix putei TaxID=3080811 RepID=A0AA95HDQ4_9GAMM|nr:MAG: MoxR family ATPase [Candidatus Thiothrix putei]